MTKIATALVHPPGYAPDIVSGATSALGRGYDVSPCADREEVRRLLSAAGCVILIDPHRCEAFDSWTDAETRIPPVVLVTPADEDPAAPIPALAPHVRERLPLTVLDHDLLRVATKAIVEDMYWDLPRRVRSSPLLVRYPLLQSAIVVAVEERLKSVQSVARVLGCSIRQLEREWREASDEIVNVSGRALPNPKHFLRLLLFLRALMAWLGPRHLRPAWVRIAEELGVHPRTVRRLFRELSGEPPSWLEIENVPALLEGIEHEVLRVLC